MAVEDRMSMLAAKSPREPWAELMLEGAQEIADMRRKPTLTDAEREALERLCEATNESIADDKRAGGCHWQDDAAAVAVVRGLLERLSPPAT